MQRAVFTGTRSTVTQAGNRFLMARRIVQQLNECIGKPHPQQFFFRKRIDSLCQEGKTCRDLPKGHVMKSVGRNNLNEYLAPADELNQAFLRS